MTRYSPMMTLSACNSRSKPSQLSGYIVEIFSGIQGEGLHVGRRHIFLRLAGCDFRCDYCDQPEALVIPDHALIEQTPGRRDFSRVMNPLSLKDAERAVSQLHRPPGLHRALAVTGGEPLLQAEFLAELLPRLHRRGLKILLETNGARPDALRVLLPCLDIVSMDFKLRSATGRPAPLKAHERFLRLAVRRGIETYVKAVVAEGSGVDEIARAARLIARVKKSVPLVIQPVTARGKIRSPRPKRLLALQESAGRFLRDVRVIPQTHKIMGQR